MAWDDVVAAKMQRCNRIRAELGDLASPVDEMERPAGMRRTDFARKRRILARLEGEIAATLRFKLGKYKSSIN